MFPSPFFFFFGGGGGGVGLPSRGDWDCGFLRMFTNQSLVPIGTIIVLGVFKPVYEENWEQSVSRKTSQIKLLDNQIYKLKTSHVLKFINKP